MKKGIDSWVSLKVTPTELRLSTTLSAGQSFTWVSTGHREWAGVLGGHLLSLRQSSQGDVEFSAPLESISEASARDLLVSYFQLQVPLGPLYASWAASDPKNFAKKALSFPGLRILRYDASPIDCELHLTIPHHKTDKIPLKLHLHSSARLITTSRESLEWCRLSPGSLALTLAPGVIRTFTPFPLYKLSLETA